MKSQFWQCFFLLTVLFTANAEDSSAAVNTNPINTLSMKGILGSPASGQDSGFKQALQPSEFHFPRDHLAHQAYKTEWWYFSGNLSSGNMSPDNLQGHDNVQKFAYQFTLFRFALLPDGRSQQGASVWRSNNIYMAHIALTDINGEKFYQQERFSRDGLGLAGVGKKDDGSLQFWLNDWRVQSLAAEQLFPLKLHIKDKEFVLNLQLEPAKPFVLQGDKGLSQKSSQHASYYYSYTRLNSMGEIKIGNKTFQVSGNSWFDREWSTSSLAKNQQGWDWFALHLNDGSDLMLYQMRKKDGAKDSYSSGVVVDSQGKSKHLQASQFQITAIDFWQSPASGIRYPVSWLLLIPEKNIKLTVSAQLKQQEWSKAGGFSFNYWEGSVAVNGTIDQQPVSGSGYLEMTGYD